VIAGTIVARGPGKLVDTSGNTISSGTWNGGVTIVNETMNKETTANAVWDHMTTEHTTAGTFGAIMNKVLTVGKFLGLK
jgi:hypothetical protein